MNPRIFNSLLLLGSLLLLLSCGGGSGDKDAVAGADGGALKGHIRVQDSEKELVLSDRQYHEIPAIGEWIKEQEAGGEKGRPFSRFSADGRYILQIQPDLDCEEGNGLGFRSDGVYCFTVFDENYSVLGKFSKKIGYYSSGGETSATSARLTGASLSQDGQHVAITRFIPKLGKWRLLMWTVNGEKISASETSEIKNMGQPVWLADGSLVLSMDNSIVRTDPYSTLVTSTIKRFPEDEKARPRWVSVSHDGKQLVFGRSVRELWGMDLDGGNLRQVVKLSASDIWTLAPGGAWSPDDAWIAFRVTIPSGPTGTPAVPLGETTSLLLAVPSNASSAIATTTTGLSERSPEVISIQSYSEQHGNLSDLFFTSSNNLKHLIWVPE